jgi:hypothetical protein
VLRQTPATVGILVFRDDNQVKEEDIYDIFTVELNKKQGRGLGLSIVGKRNDVGVYISDIVSVSGNTNVNIMGSRKCLMFGIFRWLK